MLYRILNLKIEVKLKAKIEIERNQRSKRNRQHLNELGVRRIKNPWFELNTSRRIRESFRITIIKPRYFFGDSN